MSLIKKIIVQDIEISVSMRNDNEDYICLTDMVKAKDGDDHIRNWMRNRNTIEYLGTWEMIHNLNFKGVEFDTFMHEAGANSFNMTPRKWIEATNAMGIISKTTKICYLNETKYVNLQNINIKNIKKWLKRRNF
ncbi:hypothetical protein AGMMS49965_16060 [Bacteroidia bacterium]|nr:hypothetical protein AGMMS49965_16060 [Bacteroidia bacterium]